ncbi:class I SAM-dependent methyltransferase [Bacteriovoracales bacterium]|nr:class I SAM-dependent methyltransferase [Bacteriovoracales bacterium]
MKSIIKSLLKKILPLKVRQKIHLIQCRILGLESSYKGLKTDEIFDRIYKEGVWGKNESGESTSGSGSHAVEVIQPYIDVIKGILNELAPATIVDLGCGDFNIGKNFVEKSNSYIACDVSRVILNRNRGKFQFNNLSFRNINIVEDRLPEGDVAFVRQVLQHLKNDDIKSFVRKLNEHRPYKHLFVTEHLPAKKGFTPNKDKPSGPNIRVTLSRGGSGVVLEDSPFFLKYSSKKNVLEVHETSGGIDAIIRTTMYTL